MYVLLLLKVLLVADCGFWVLDRACGANTMYIRPRTPNQRTQRFFSTIRKGSLEPWDSRGLRGPLESLTIST